MGLDLFDAIGRKLRYERDLCDLKLSTATKELEDARARDNESRLEFKSRQEEKVAAEKAAYDAETKTEIAREALVQAERKVAVASSVVANKDSQIVQFHDCDSMLQQWTREAEERHEQAMKVAQEDASRLKLQIEQLHGSVQQNVDVCAELEKARQEIIALRTSLDNARAISSASIGERDSLLKDLENATGKLAQHQKEASILRDACEQEATSLHKSLQVAKAEAAAALQQVDLLRKRYEEATHRHTSCLEGDQLRPIVVDAVAARHDEDMHVVRMRHECAGNPFPKVSRSVSDKTVDLSSTRKRPGAADILMSPRVRSQEQVSVSHQQGQHHNVSVGRVMLPTEADGATTSRSLDRHGDQPQQRQQPHRQQPRESQVLLQQSPRQPAAQELEEKQTRGQEQHDEQDLRQQPTEHPPQLQQQQQQQQQQCRQQQKQQSQQQQQQDEQQQEVQQNQKQRQPQAPSRCLEKQRFAQRLPSGSFAERQAMAVRVGKRKEMHAVGCQDCGRAGPLFYDRTDAQEYCSQCWVSFYGQFPPSASSVSVSAACAGGAPAASEAGKSSSTSSSKAAHRQEVGSNSSRLPEDAPRGHRAHAECKIKHSGDGSPQIYFHYQRGGSKIPFQTTFFACGGSRHAAETIARACYLKFEQGWQKADVLAFRKQCYARLAQCGPIIPASVGNTLAERRTLLPGMQGLRAGA